MELEDGVVQHGWGCYQGEKNGKHIGNGLWYHRELGFDYVSTDGHEKIMEIKIK